MHHDYHHKYNESRDESEKKRKAITDALGLIDSANDREIDDAARNCYEKLGQAGVFRSPLTCAINDFLMGEFHAAFLAKARGRVNSQEYQNLVVSWAKLIRLYLVFKKNHQYVQENYREYNQSAPRGTGPIGCGRLVLNYVMDRFHYETELDPRIPGSLRNNIRSLEMLLGAYKNANPNRDSVSFILDQQGKYMLHLEALMNAYETCNDSALQRKIQSVLFPVLLFLLSENYFTEINEKLFGYFEKLPKVDDYWISLNDPKPIPPGESARLMPPKPPSEDEKCVCRLI